MAFDRTKLALDSCVQNSDLPRDWKYTSDADTQATINTTGYFNGAIDLLKEDDRIIAVDSAGSLDEYRVNLNDGTNVDVDNGTAIDGGTDSD